MKMMKPNFSLFFLVLTSLVFSSGASLGQEKANPGKTIVSIRYYNVNSSIQYLVLQSQLKKDGQITALKGKKYDVYLDKSDTANLIGKFITDRNGMANAVIPPSLKQAWEAASQHIFIVNEGGEEIISDYTINKANISIDTTTTDSIHSITASVQKWDNGKWVPAEGVEMKLGIKRLGGVLPAGDDLTVTTDSSGTATTELKKLDLPGDIKGNYTLVAQVDDNDLYGNIMAEKVVPWGTKLQPDNTFFQKRTLWSTRRHAPFWLLFMAFGIIISVWSTMIYLIFQIVKIKKIGLGETVL
jgi:hypothetical protein